MATSNILYLEKKNLNSRTMREATRSDPCPSGTSELQVVAGMASNRDQRNDWRGTASLSGSGNNQHNTQGVPQNDSPHCKSIVMSNKASENVGILTQLHGDNNNGARLLENTFSSVVSSPVAARSTDFQFDVSSDDGIQLSVDLNSTLSDWIENMKGRVHICQCHDVHRRRTEGFQELGRFCSTQLKNTSALDLDKEMNNGSFEDGSPPTTSGTGVKALAGEIDVGEGSLYSLGQKSCEDTLRCQENIGEKHAVLSSRMECDIVKEVSDVKSDREDKARLAESAVNILTQIKTFNFSRKSCDPKHSGMSENQVLHAANGIDQKSSQRHINGSFIPASMYMLSPASTPLEIQASPPRTILGQDMGPSPFRAGTSTSMDMHDELQNTEREHCALHKSLQVHENQHQLHGEKADASRCASCSIKPSSIEAEHCRAEASSESNGQVIKAQSHPATCPEEGLPLSLYKRNGSLGIVHLTNNIETENDDFVRPHGSGQESNDVPSSAVGFQREVALLSPCGNGVSMDLVVPEKNGVNHCILVHSNEHAEENFKSQAATSLGNLGTSNLGDRRHSSECLDRDLMERIGMKPANFDSTSELKRKRQFSSVEDQSNNFVNSDSRMLRTSKQSTGDVHAKRRRSSRLFTKVLDPSLITPAPCHPSLYL